MAKMSRATRVQVDEWREQYSATEVGPVIEALCLKLDTLLLRLERRRKEIDDLELTVAKQQKQLRRNKTLLKQRALPKVVIKVAK